ncbi:50S ribosomal protein L11 [bacterium]|nr:50S ribosomal protein L11 [bacterium]|tara:strand:+ start:9097 stop:9522 length:426 start_codon:yes stop_codon:yes gene_type:complete
MAKKVVKQIKVQAPGGKATPAGTLGPALGQAGVNIGEFVTRFNDATKDKMGVTVPAVISVYEDRTFDFVVKTPPASVLLKKAAGVDKGSGTNLTKKAGKVTAAQVKEIAEEKMQDLSANDVDQASKIIEGTARSMGIEVTK